MQHQLTWESELPAALARAVVGNKAVLLDFFNPG